MCCPVLHPIYETKNLTTYCKIQRITLTVLIYVLKIAHISDSIVDHTLDPLRISIGRDRSMQVCSKICK